MNGLFGRIASGVVAKLSLLLDLVLFLVALALSAAWSAEPLGPWHPAELVACWLSLLAWVLTATALRHYDPWACDRALHDDLAMVSILVLAVTTTLAVAQRALEVSVLPEAGLFLVVFWPAALVLRVGFFRALSEREGPMDEVLVVGAGPLGHATAEQIARRHRHRVLGHLRLPEEKVAEELKGRVIGQAAELDQVLKSMAVGEVYLASTAPQHAQAQQAAIRVCERYGVPFAIPAYGYRLGRASPVDLHAIADGYLHFQSVAIKPTQQALKRLFDIVASAVALWLLVPLLVAVAAAIKLTSRGPVFFRQTRLGLQGRPFRMLKFRTMVVDAEAQKASLAALNEADGPNFKIRRDPRVTAVGRFLRRASIDELPQLVNVLRGDMSLVGPRPPLPNEVAKYEGWQRRRLSVRPGLTCIWQVSGRNELSFEQWMYMDMQYIDTWSFAKDLRLIWKTVPVVLTGKGAS